MRGSPESLIDISKLGEEACFVREKSLQQPDGEPAPGFSLADCQEVFGDEHQRTVTRSGGSDLSGVSSRPVRLHFVLRARICFRLSLSSSPAIALAGAGHAYAVVRARS